MISKLTIKILFLIFLGSIHIASYCIAQSSPMQVFDDVVRTSQLYGNSDSSFSFCIRPIYSLSSFDSLSRSAAYPKESIQSIPKRFKNVVLQPVILQQQYNTRHAYGWNDGSMIPAKGYQNHLSFGASYKKGMISLQVRPEAVFAYNSYFSTSPMQIDNVWYAYNEIITNVIDAPERFGYGRYAKFFPGQSHLKINYRKLSFGISTENLWWGPGIRNSILMSNNAPGFPHLSFNTTQPVKSPVGTFEWQLMSGILKGSKIVPDDTSRRFNGRDIFRPKPFKGRYLNGVVIAWQPKWTKGLFLGISRVFYQYLSDIRPGIDGYVPVVGKFFKKNLPSEDAQRRDQLASFFFRLILPKEKAEVYGEYGRNDHSYNLTDFYLQPEHSRAYTLGLSKIFDGRKKDLQLYAEMTGLQMPSTMLIRQGQSWYVHYQIREGYTNYGQVIGAGIGPGSSSQTIGMKLLSGFDRMGVSFERVVRNNDFYYSAFGPLADWRKNWVDLSMNLNKSWRTKRIIYEAHLSYVRSLNYQWYYPHTTNLNARLGLCYIL
jgi:hypothetical protein